ncbi:hypothetical protein [Streptomyces collinus]|uniref:hypothetical protein n=1 Tax=Streptomyces collinus TaxID=42684 RepID=UPI00331F6C9B
MTTPAASPLEGQPLAPTGQSAAGPAAPRPVVGEPKGAARKGVVTALRSEQFQTDEARQGTADPTPGRPGIRIYAPPVYRHHWDSARWSTRPGCTPTAAYTCPCGQTSTATGPRAVAALVAEYGAHRSACTGMPAVSTEGRAAA